MAANRIIPRQSEQLSPREAETHLNANSVAKSEKREQQQHTAIRAGSTALVILAGVAVLTVCYLAKLVLVTLMVSIVLAFVLEPIVRVLERIRLPRSVGALVAVFLLVGACYGASYFFYNRAVSFVHDLPKYSQKIKGVTSRVKQQTDQIQKTTQNVMPQDNSKEKKPMPVTVENGPGSSPLTENLGAVTEVLVTLIFIPFLVYFMLSWQEHARTKTVQLFRPEHRSTAYVTLGQISLMMRSFLAGNLIIAIFLSVGSMIVFGLMGLPYFYFLGIISGFLSVVPYLGVVLAMVPPLAAGMGDLDGKGVLIIVVTVTGLHMFAMNVLYPKILGKRLQLNPLVVTISLLLWGWIWGALGLILAVPIMGILKIICDHVASLRPIGAWMGE